MQSDFMYDDTPEPNHSVLNELEQVHDNLPLWLGQFARQSRVIASVAVGADRQIGAAAPQLTPEVESELRWLMRLYSNSMLFSHPDRAYVEAFTTTVNTVCEQLARGDALSQRMGEAINTVSREAACTDWASSLLIDMLAIKASADLENKISQLNKTENQAARQENAVAFASAHRQDFDRLLRFVAFKQQLQVSEHIDRSQSENLEQALYIYMHLQRVYDLPGGALPIEMGYAHFAEEAFGSRRLQQGVQAASVSLSNGAISANRLLLLDQLGVYGLEAWQHLRFYVDGNTQLSQHQLHQRIQALVDQLNGLDTSSPAYDDESSRLMKMHQQLDHALASLLQSQPENPSVQALLRALSH